MTLQRRCSNCDHWTEQSRIQNADEVEIGQFGFCRRNAPVIAVVRGLRIDQWPSTLNDDRCGEFKANDRGPEVSAANPEVTAADLIAWFKANYMPSSAGEVIESIEQALTHLAKIPRT